MGFIRKNDGAISIFLCIIMMANIILLSILIEATRVRWAETQIEEAMESTSNSVLAGYQSMLKDLFGIFALAENNTDCLDEEVENYLNKTLMTELGVEKDELEGDAYKFLKGLFTNAGKYEKVDFLNLYDYRIEDIKTEKIQNLTENAVLKNQILEYMKYRAPEKLAEGFVDKVTAFKGFGKQSEVMSKKTEIDKELNVIYKYQTDLSSAVEETNKFNTQDDKDFSKDKYLQSSLKELKTLIADRIIFEKRLSNKGEKDKDGKIRQKINGRKTETDKLISKTIDNVKTYIEFNKDGIEAIDNIYEYSETANSKISELEKSSLKNDNSDFAKSMKNEIKIKKAQVDKKSLAKIEKKLEQNIDVLSKIKEIAEKINQNKIVENAADMEADAKDRREISEFIGNEINETELNKLVEKYNGTCNNSEIKYLKNTGNSDSKEADDPRKDAEKIVKSGIAQDGNKKEIKLEDEDLVSKTKKSNEIEIFKKYIDLDILDEKFLSDLFAKTNSKRNDDNIAETSGADDEIKSKHEKYDVSEIVDNVEFTESKKKGFSENGLEFVANIGSAIKDGLADIRDDLYINEYIMGTFKNTLTENKDESDTERDLRGALKKSRNTFFNTSEVEYILTGSKNENSNEYAIKAQILLIRFALNSLYIYMDPQKNSVAMETATIVAGWSGFGVPIVHTLIMLGWAMAESVVDVNSLMNGEKVPIFKTKDTWVLGEAGMIKTLAGEVAEKAADIGKKAVDLGVDSAADISKTMISRADEFIKSKIKIAVDGLFAPLENSINQATEKAGEIYDDITDSAEKSIFKNNSTMKTIETKIYNYAQTKYQNIKSTIEDKLIKLPSEKAKELIYDTKQKIYSEIYNNISGLVSKLEAEIDNVSKSSKEKINDFIDTSLSGFTGTEKTDNNFKSSLLSLDYKDYLRIFLLIENENSKLDRIEDLIQLNMRKESGYNNFLLSNYNTRIRVEATISFKYMFVPGFGKNENRLQNTISRHVFKSVMYKGYY